MIKDCWLIESSKPAKDIELCWYRLILEDRDRQLETVKVKLLFFLFVIFRLSDFHGGQKYESHLSLSLLFNKFVFWPITYNRVQQDSQMAVMTLIRKTWRVTSTQLSSHHGYLRNHFMTFFVVDPDQISRKKNVWATAE